MPQMIEWEMPDNLIHCFALTTVKEDICPSFNAWLRIHKVVWRQGWMSSLAKLPEPVKANRCSPNHQEKTKGRAPMSEREILESSDIFDDLPPSPFDILDGDYKTPHPILGTLGRSFPITGYEMKRAILASPESVLVKNGWTFNGLLAVELARLDEVLAAMEHASYQDNMRIVEALYPLLKEHVESGDEIAAQAFEGLYIQSKALLASSPKKNMLSSEKVINNPTEKVSNSTNETLPKQKSEHSVSQEENTEKTTRKIKGVFAAIGALLLVVLVFFAIIAIMHYFGYTPSGRSFLGMVPWWDPDGMSIFERICQLLGWS